MPTTTPSEPPAGFALALETSSLWGSVALGCGDEVLRLRALDRPRRHAADLLPVIAGLCQDEGVSPERIEAVYVSAGPGSFTGLRIGFTVARTLALAHGARVLGVPSLTVLAQNALAAEPVPTRVVVMTDAQRGRVYAAFFKLDGERFTATTEPEEVNPADGLTSLVPEQNCAGQGAARAAEATGKGVSDADAPGEGTANVAVLGEAVEMHRAVIGAAGWRMLPEEFSRPSAAALYALGRAKALRSGFSDPRTLLPLYVRRPEAEEKREQRHGGAGE
ncbi:MAG TPA: tRNA (adenosine(37)-N6)-threonylcarbamoyltransferase complex dimerization subunit type 1 TsaB [Phycisphaerae bacterium]|nr:tRNA (adenosine(37)-N6)-threonylcarbamoyltransferase complex dimerization subunit type 1 TsaB [Phycisphaerae bacterium]HNU46053.1 tRNA (adenosine(37)-N6)-threonylcarbamoyltransferase complex dimerization subunit type 1 TsaB [Phycisphaerae bacterium]